MKNIAINPEDYTILAVDDIATNIMLLKAVLSRAKYKIVTASGGNEALEKAATELPDLILLDIMMPDMDGYEVIKHLKADPALQDIPVIFLTALHNPEDIVKGFKLGASDYVSKPFNHEELINRVSHHIYLAAAQRTNMQQRDELPATVDARDKMYSVIAHDLRSPIGTLKMVFNMLSINLTQQQIGEDNMEMITMGNNITESTFMLLDNLLKSGDLGPADRALASRLFYGVIERRLTLDYVLAACSTVPIKKMHPCVTEILRCGIYQLLYMDKIPPSAAVSEAVNLTKALRQPRASGFVNGVLRGVERKKGGLLDGLPDTDEGLEITYS